MPGTRRLAETGYGFYRFGPENKKPPELPQYGPGFRIEFDGLARLLPLALAFTIPAGGCLLLSK
jgi:hypothetical protein